MIGITKLRILILVSMTLTFFQGHTCMRNKQTNVGVHFSEKSQSIWMTFSLLPQPVGFLKLLLNLFGASNIQGRELC